MIVKIALFIAAHCAISNSKPFAERIITTSFDMSIRRIDNQKDRSYAFFNVIAVGIAFVMIPSLCYILYKNTSYIRSMIYRVIDKQEDPPAKEQR